MRFLRLSMLAFGPFSDTVLDLSQGQEGLHLIHGDNEAGKSASLRAMTNFLYGIPLRSTDNFRHQNKDLRIGAALRLSDGRSIECIRRKGNKNTLIDDGGRPVADSFLSPFLGGIDQDLFALMYGLDHALLTRGGRQLIEASGDMGQSLFAAGAGLAGMRDVLSTLTAEADEWFRPRGKNQPINRLTAEFRALRKKIRDVSLPASQWERHEHNLENARQKKEALAASLVAAIAERNRLERLKNAIPLIAALKGLRAELEVLGDAPHLPGDFPEKRRAAQHALEQARIRRSRLVEEQAAIQAETARLSPSMQLIRAQAEISGLFQQSGGHAKAQLDLPRRRADYHRLRDEAGAILKRLGPQTSIEGVEAFRLTDSQIARLQRLGRAHTPLEEKIRTLKKERQDLADQLRALQEAFERLPPVVDTDAIESACKLARRQGDLETRRRQAETGVAARCKNTAAELARLGLWEGSLEHLETLPVPTVETVRRFEGQLAAASAYRQKISAEMKERRQQINDTLQRIRQMEAAGAVPAETELSAARALRERGWRLVQRSWIHQDADPEEIRGFLATEQDSTDANTLATAYADSVRRADDIADLLRRESDRIAQMTGYRLQLAEARRQLAELETTQDEADSAHSVLEAGWRDCWEAAGIDPLPPKEMEEWLQRHRRLCELAADLRSRQEELQRLEAMIGAYRDDITAGLSALGLATAQGAGLELLIDQGETAIAASQADRQTRERLVTDIQAVEKRISMRDRDLAAADSDRNSLRCQWAEAVRPLGLGPEALPEEVDAVVARIQAVFEKIDKAAEMQGRIRAIQSDSEKFALETSKICRRLAPDLEALPPEEATAALNERLQEALADSARLKELEKRQRAIEKELRQELAAMDAAHVLLSQMCRSAGVASVEDLPEAERRSQEARQIQSRIESALEALSRYSAGTTLADFIEEAQKQDADALPALIEARDTDIRSLEAQRSMVDQSIGSEQAALSMMDGRGDAADLAARSEEMLAELREAVETYARLKIAAILLQKEIERYREAHQGPILRRAGQIFRRLTSQSFSGVAPEYDDRDTPVLVGVRPTGEKTGVSGMSDGTCDQLYLALRLASIEERLAESEPMPLILDDILVNFDNRRAAAALQVLGELSRKTQVIFFTHHRHLVEIAENCLDSNVLFLHNL